MKKLEEVAWSLSTLPDQIDLQDILEKIEEFNGIHCPSCKLIMNVESGYPLEHPFVIGKCLVSNLLVLKCSFYNCGAFYIVPLDSNFNHIKEPEI